LRAGVDAVASVFQPKPRLVHNAEQRAVPSAPRRAVKRVKTSSP
jgi:hypothetical protein